MQKQHLLITKVRLALPVMVLLYLLLTCFSSANYSFSLQAFGKFRTGKSIEQASDESVFKEKYYPLKVSAAAPVNASGSGILNELESLLAVPLLFLLWAFFFFRPLPESLFQKPVWRLSFLHIHHLFPNGP